MKLNFLTCLLLLFSSFAHSQCVECYSLEDALIEPENVIYLDLSGSGLKEIPKEIAALINLEELNLSNNQLLEFPFTDSVSLTHLKSLDLSNNFGFSTFSFEDDFLENSQLALLDVSNCSIHRLNPNLGKLKNLVSINLSRNLLTSFSASLADAKNLKKINLSNNRLKHSRNIFSNFWKLEDLDISGNKGLDQEHVFLSLMYKDNLQTLALTLSDSIKVFSGIFSELPVKNLIIKGSTIESFTNELKKNETISSITFDDCKLSKPEKVYGVLKAMKNLKELNFIGTTVSKDINDLDQIEAISVVNSVIPQSCAFHKMKQLKKIDLTGSEVDKSQLKNENLIAAITKDYLPLTENMINNTVEPIVEITPVQKKVDSKIASQFKTENASFAIPQNAFLNQDGSVYNGEVNIQIKEYFNPVAIALAGAPMVMNTGGRNELFSSNGMMEFTAIDQSGNELKANPASIIRVSMKDIQPDQQSSLFSYDQTTNNWTTISTPKSTNYDSIRKAVLDSLNLLSDDQFTETICIPKLFSMNADKKRNDPSEISFNSHSHPSLKSLSNNKRKQYIKTPNADQSIIAEYTWKIDTLLNPEIIELLDEIKRAKNKKAYHRKYRRSSEENIARPIQDLAIKPDFENDHFILTMNFKGTLISLPVYLDRNESMEKNMRLQNSFYEKYLKKVKKEKKFMDGIMNRQKGLMKRIANEERERIASMYIIAMSNPTQKEMLDFGLANFGLINCDYFSRNKPADYLVFDKQMKDQNNNSVELPDEARIILMGDNSYLTSTLSQIPVFTNQKTVVFFKIGPDALAVIKGDGIKQSDFTLKTFSIIGLNTQEISNLLLN